MENSPTPDAANVPKRWFTKAFGQRYLDRYAHRDLAQARTEITELLAWLQLRPPARVLDAPCGWGRHLHVLLELGFEAAGVDLSQPLLRQAVLGRGLGGKVACADLLALPVHDWADLTVDLFNSLGYFADDALNRQALGQLVSTVRRGGRLVIEHMNRARVERELVPHDQQVEAARVTESWRRIENNRVIKRSVVCEAGRTEEYVESVRMFAPDELVEWLGGAGLDEVLVAGDFSGGPFNDSSSRMVVVGRRG